MGNRKRILLTGAVVAASSQLYWNLFTPNFRVSASVLLLPVLLMTIGKSAGTVKTCAATAVMVFFVRAALLFFALGSLPGKAVLFLVPGSLFYLVYGLLFRLFIKSKYTAGWKRLFPAILLCDFLSNLAELTLQELLTGYVPFFFTAGSLFFIAVFRTLLAGLCLTAEAQYRALLSRTEHEDRYRRLFLMTANLKNEVYFMRKNSEEIESIMSGAYRLYETLQGLDVPEETRRTALSIARDVHEIKKDYMRIIQGIEQKISAEYDEKQMELKDIFRILEETTHRMSESLGLRLSLDFSCQDNFVTGEHYALMAVLKNLVTNAVEAIASKKSTGTVSLREHIDGDTVIFTVIDSGPGILPRHLPNIFKMGYSTKFNQETGNIYRGVGLCGVKMTVEEKFGGAIGVESEPGKGTVFTLHIPAKALKGGTFF